MTPDGRVELISKIISDILSIDCAVLMGATIAHEVANEHFSEATIGKYCCNEHFSEATIGKYCCNELSMAPL